MTPAKRHPSGCRFRFCRGKGRAMMAAGITRGGDGDVTTSGTLQDWHDFYVVIGAAATPSAEVTPPFDFITKNGTRSPVRSASRSASART